VIDLKTLLELAEHNSPSLKAAYYDFKAAVENAGYASGWANPMFSYGYHAESVEGVRPREHSLSVTQPFM